MLRLINITVLTALLTLLLPFFVKAGDTVFFAKNGVFNLSDFDFSKHDKIKLHGKWKFFKGRFYNSAQVKNDSCFCYLDVPKNWKGQVCKNEILPAEGFGTYYLQIIFSKKNRDEKFLLNTRYIPNSSRIYFNNRLVGYGGKIGENEAGSKPSLNITLNEFPVTSDTVDLVIQVSNFHLNKGGIYYEIEIGHARDINEYNTLNNVGIFFIIGCIFLMVMYYLILYFLRRKEKSALYFSLLCLCIAFYTLCLSDLYFYFVPFFNFAVDFKIKHGLIYIALLAMSVYIYTIFKAEFSRLLLKIIIIVCSLFSLAMIFFSTRLNSDLFSYFRYFGILVTLYVIYVIVRAKINKRDGAGIFIFGLVGVFLSVVNDTLFSMGIIATTDLLPFGMVLFLLVQTFLLSSRFTKSFAKTEELTVELTYINKNLENIVEERTREITYQKKEIEEKNEELSQLLEEVTAQRDQIDAQKELVIQQKEHIETIHHDISQSIDYAKRIQGSILSDVSILKEHFADHFLLFKPKDKVSGDFYWWHCMEGYVIIAAADCTGHGVPGGFMSMLGISFLRELIVKEYLTHTGIILRRLRKEIINVMKQRGESGEQKDGMDMVLISIKLDTKLMQFSGANNPLYHIRDGVLTEYKGDKMPIAIYEKMDKFSTAEVQLISGDQIYMFSDGYADQFGGPLQKKFKYKPFKELILKNCHLDMTEQKTILDKNIIDWTGDYEQVDDVLVMGIRI